MRVTSPRQHEWPIADSAVASFVLLGGVAAIVSFSAGILFGSSALRVAMILVVGVAAAAGLFVFWFIGADPEES